MAQHRVGTRGEHGGQPASVAVQEAMAHGVHAAVDRMQRATRKAVLNRAASEPEICQLGSRDHPMLRTGKFGDQSVASSVQLTTYVMASCTLDRHAAMVTPPALRV